MTNIVDPIEKQRAYAQTTQANFYAQALEISSQFLVSYEPFVFALRFGVIFFFGFSCGFSAVVMVSSTSDFSKCSLSILPLPGTAAA